MQRHANTFLTPLRRYALGVILAVIAVLGFARTASAQDKEGQDYFVVKGPNPASTYVRIGPRVNIHTPSFAKKFGTTPFDIREDNPDKTLALCRHAGDGFSMTRGITSAEGRKTNAVWETCKPPNERYVYIVPGTTIEITGVKHLTIDDKLGILDALEACTDADCVNAELKKLGSKATFEAPPPQTAVTPPAPAAPPTGAPKAETPSSPDPVTPAPKAVPSGTGSRVRILDDLGTVILLVFLSAFLGVLLTLAVVKRKKPASKSAVSSSDEATKLTRLPQTLSHAMAEAEAARKNLRTEQLRVEKLRKLLSDWANDANVSLKGDIADEDLVRRLQDDVTRRLTEANETRNAIAGLVKMSHAGQTLPELFAAYQKQQDESLIAVARPATDTRKRMVEDLTTAGVRVDDSLPLEEVYGLTKEKLRPAPADCAACTALWNLLSSVAQKHDITVEVDMTAAAIVNVMALRWTAEVSDLTAEARDLKRDKGSLETTVNAVRGCFGRRAAERGLAIPDDADVLDLVGQVNDHMDREVSTVAALKAEREKVWQTLHDRATAIGLVNVPPDIDLVALLDLVHASLARKAEDAERRASAFFDESERCARLYAELSELNSLLSQIDADLEAESDKSDDERDDALLGQLVAAQGELKSKADPKRREFDELHVKLAGFRFFDAAADHEVKRRVRDMVTDHEQARLDLEARVRDLESRLANAGHDSDPDQLRDSLSPPRVPGGVEAPPAFAPRDANGEQRSHTLPAVPTDPNLGNGRIVSALPVVEAIHSLPAGRMVWIDDVSLWGMFSLLQKQVTFAPGVLPDSPPDNGSQEDPNEMVRGATVADLPTIIRRFGLVMPAQTGRTLRPQVVRM